MFQTLLIQECKKLNLPQYEVKDTAPATFKDLVQAYSETKKLIIWSDASENTIWGVQGNWLFRAWHDFIHIKHQTEFTENGEYRTFLAQAAQTESSFLQKLIKLEIVGQFDYYKTSGRFPVNQLNFLKESLKYVY